MRIPVKFPQNTTLVFGILAGLIACLIGAGWQVATRYGVTSSLTPIDLSLFRYAIPALLLLPFWRKEAFFPTNVPIYLVTLMVFGAGLPFGLMVMTGSQHAPVAHLAALLPGAMPLFVALLSRLFLDEKHSISQISGYMLVVSGIAIISWESLSSYSSDTWQGDILFLCAAFSWGIYIIAFRKSGLSAWHGTALVNAWSLILVIPVWLWMQSGTLFSAAPGDILIQVLWQGVLAGFIGLWIYGYSLAQLGATRSAAVGALVPVFSAAGGWLFLQEALDTHLISGIAIVASGVLLSTGISALFTRKHELSGS
ncbi:MAG: DMT family transporter [Sneathiella sp.]